MTQLKENHVMKTHIKQFILANSLIGLIALAGTANAEIMSVTVGSSQPFDGANGYQYVEAIMNGTVERDDGTLGHYSVPVILIHPDDGGNGAAVVDIVNTTLIQSGWINEWLIGPYGLVTTGDYLFEEGYTYLGVQWDKQTTDAFGPTPTEGGNHLAYGSIEEFEDAFEILRDAARFLRDPVAFDGFTLPASVDVVISAGYSQSGTVQNAMVRQGEDYADEELLFDGHVVGVAGSNCNDLDGSFPGFSLCDSSPPDDGARIITIEAQTDVEFFEFFASPLTRFPENPNYRRYELAGVSHIPKVYAVFHPAQNPADPSPVFRGAYQNLLAWTLWDIPAPPSIFLDGTINPDGSLDTVYDNDGNIAGGLRLPHMAAPLGTYTGMWFAGELIFELISGEFIPFDDADLAERYPNPGSYVSRVAQAAESLFEDRYIIESDRDAFVTAAAQSDIGKRSDRRPTLNLP